MSDTSAHDRDAIEDQRKRFRGRAYDARRQASYFLVLILALLVGAAAVFVFAAQIANKDATFEIDQALSKLQADRKNIEDSLDAIITTEFATDYLSQRGIVRSLPAFKLSDCRNALVLTVAARARLREWAPVAAEDSELAYKTECTINEQTSRVLFVKLSTTGIPRHQEIRQAGLNIQAIRKSIQSLELQRTAQLALAGARSSSEPNQLPETGKKDELWLTLVQTNVTRFGTIILVIFLVSILVPLYRYNVRLGAYYDARADALALMGGSNITAARFTEFADALTPSHDFGKAPATPAQQVIELAKAIASRSGGKPG